jgi:type II secretory pathway pseudopilin PulG
MRKIMKKQRNNQAFTLIEIMVTIAIIILLMGILVPALRHARTSANRVKSSSQIGNIHAGFVSYAQNNNEWFPGTDAIGQFVNYNYNHFTRANGGPKETLLPSIAYGLLINNLIIKPDELVSPIEKSGVRFIFQISDTNKADTSSFGTNYYSYAMMYTGTYDTSSKSYSQRERKALWRNNGNSQQPIVSDRGIEKDVNGDGNMNSVSIHDTNDYWKGNLGWNDGHVTWELRQKVSTKMSAQKVKLSDDLFDDDDGDETDNFIMEPRLSN